MYEVLRDAGPVVWSDDVLGGAWLLTRYADIVTALQDPRLSAARADAFAQQFDGARQRQLTPFTEAFGRWLLFMDAPHHSRLRKALNYGFKPAVLEALRPRIERLVDELLLPLLSPDMNPDSGNPPREFDFIREFAHPLPARVIAEMLGVPESEQPRFIRWSDDIVAFMGSLSAGFETALRAQDALLDMTAYFGELLARRAGEQDELQDLTGLLLAAQRRGEFAADEELLAQCSMFFAAGHETTRNLFGNGLHALLRHPDQAALLRVDPGLMPRALRELLRYDSPVQFTGRRASEDLRLHGCTIRRGQHVLLLIGSGNRDPDRFADPDRLDLTRDQGPPLSFGYGPHVCIGATLSYLEAGIAFARLVADLPGVRCLDADPHWVDNPAFRGLHSLRLTRVASAGVTPEGLGESKTRAGAMDGTGSWSTAG
jgi:hypothetical protein